MAELHEPASVEKLYASWDGERPSPARPLMQGDVFEGIVLPGLGDEPRYAQIVMHPCNMRRGASLRERITVAPVEPHSMRSADWQKSLRIMPLPELFSSGDASYKTDLCDFVSVPSRVFDLSKRVVALSNEGVLILQQRLVMTQTRLLVHIDKFQEQMAPTFTELELQEDWVEEAIARVSGNGASVAAATDEAIRVFQEWLSPFREKLGQAREHSQLRRDARAACEAQYNSHG